MRLDLCEYFLWMWFQLQLHDDDDRGLRIVPFLAPCDICPLEIYGWVVGVLRRHHCNILESTDERDRVPTMMIPFLSGRLWLLWHPW